MKLSELLAFAGKNSLTNDPDIIIELEHDFCLRYTGVVRMSVYIDRHDRKHLCLMPASPVVRENADSKNIQWKNIK